MDRVTSCKRVWGDGLMYMNRFHLGKLETLVGKTLAFLFNYPIYPNFKLNYRIHPSLNSCSSLMYRSPNLTVRFACFWKIGVKSRVGAPQKIVDSRGEILISLTLVFWSTEWSKAKWGIFNIKQFNILVQSLLWATFLLLHRFWKYTCIKEACEKVTFCIRSPCMILLEDAYVLGDLLVPIEQKHW